jgi:hypothetical protein
MGQLAFFIEYLKQGGLFEGWVVRCPLHLTSPNALAKREVLGTVLLSVLAGHWGYAHITALRGDGVNAPLPGMKKVVSEDRCAALGKIEEEAGGVRLAARAAEILHAAAVGAMDTRCRHHGKTALRPSGGGRGRLQPEQTGPAFARLSQLSDGRATAGAGG